MTFTIPHPNTKNHNLTAYIVAALLAAFAAGLAYIALGDTSGSINPVAERTAAVESVFTEEWLAAQTAIGAGVRVEPVFTDSWLEARVDQQPTASRPVFTDEWWAAQVLVRPETSARTVFTDEWLAAQVLVRPETSARTVFTDEWLATKTG
jgi:hypothetical protein